MMLWLLAQADGPIDDRALKSLRFGLVLIVLIGIVGVVSILLMLGAWKNFNRRLSDLEAKRDVDRAASSAEDVWRVSAERVGVEPGGRRLPPAAAAAFDGSNPEADVDPDDDDDGYLYGKEWKPGDDDEDDDEDEDDRAW
ncbi:MAG: hypothetical protein AAFX76_01990 [Planctomycetota bacterium]